MVRKSTGQKTGIILAAIGLMMITAGCTGKEQTVKAQYLGVENYGKEETNKENRDHFRYRFEIDGKERIFKIAGGAPEGEETQAYLVQNILKEGYSYTITTEGDTVTAAEELPPEGNNM